MQKSSYSITDKILNTAKNYHVYYYDEQVLTTTNISELSVQPTITEVPDGYRVSVDEVELKFSQVKSCKAEGPDHFPNWILRDFLLMSYLHLK